MEHTWHVEPALRNRDDDEFDLEERLAAAERRYAQARGLSRQAREECLALEAEQDCREDLVQQARARHERAEAKCRALRRLIEDLEEQLG